MWNRLRDLFREYGYRDDIRCLVLTGAGSDFCSGADVSGGGQAERDASRLHQLESMRNIGECCRYLYEMPKVTIARVDGVAAGGGSEPRAGAATWCSRPIGHDSARSSRSAA